MGLEIMIERLERSGHEVAVVGSDRNSVLVVDGVQVGDVREDRVYLYQ